MTRLEEIPQKVLNPLSLPLSPGSSLLIQGEIIAHPVSQDRMLTLSLKQWLPLKGKNELFYIKSYKVSSVVFNDFWLGIFVYVRGNIFPCDKAYWTVSVCSFVWDFVHCFCCLFLRAYLIFTLTISYLGLGLAIVAAKL